MQTLLHNDVRGEHACWTGILLACLAVMLAMIMSPDSTAIAHLAQMLSDLTAMLS